MSDAPEPQPTQGQSTEGSWGSTIRFLVLLFAGVFAFQSVAAKPFYIPSSSMMPALVKGDRLVVTKYPYGWSYASPSIHGATVIPGRLLGSLPERGDIVTVARRGDGADLIKRVIGLPGDTIEVRGGVVILNGREVKRVAHGTAMLPVDANLPCDEALIQFRRTGPDGKRHCELPLFRETLPNGVSYETIDLGADYLSFGDNFAQVTVPAGHVFLMGDNRDQSADSRFPLPTGLGGAVPVESLGGRAEFVTHSYDGSGSAINPLSWVTALRGDRAGESLRPAKE